MHLPIDSVLPEIVSTLESSRNLVIEVPPGAGKTTRVPPALLRFGPVVVLEPRRMAARMAARRVASEMGERVGETVGYQVRFEDVSSARTRLRYVTEGVLNRRMLADPLLGDTAVVVLDEFHERHMEGDVALALLRRLQGRRGDLKLVVMSATLDGDAVSCYLDGCPVIRSEGRLYPIEVRYTPHSAAPLEQRVREAVADVCGDTGGDVLVFLPGAAEIQRAMGACQTLAGRLNLSLHALHGSVPPEEQDRAVTPGPRRKVIFSTNVAESSVTIEGVTAVIDSGLARVARDSPWTGFPIVEIARVSQASAIQRAGRAGRMGPGRVLRLYPLEDFVRRPARDAAEILRRELSGLVLQLDAMGIAAGELEWFEAPPNEAVRAARALLDRLDASRDAAGLSRYPVHPRLAVLLREAGRAALPLVAALASGDRLDVSDPLDITERTLPPGARRLFDSLRRQRFPSGRLDLPRAILAAFPDRVARRRDNSEVVLAAGGSARLPREGHWHGDLLVAVDLEERPDRGLPWVRLATAIEPEWLIDQFPEAVSDRTAVEWNRKAERVDAVSQLLYDGFVFEESHGGRVDPEEAGRLLAAKALEAGVERFVDAEALAAYCARLEFAAAHGDFPGADIEAGLSRACFGLRNFEELRGADLLGILAQQVDPRLRGLLDEVAPERVRLAGGRWVKIRYERGRPPWIASRLQDFFGMRETPRVARGAVPLVVHLLAPSQRPVQTTTDLAGFWERLYPQVRRELMRRYPKHSWPERPSG